MKVNFGSFETFKVTIHFGYEGENIWVSVASMSELIAGGENMGVSGDFLVADAQKRFPELTEEKAVRMPYIMKQGEPSAELYWYYRIDLDLDVFGLHAKSRILVETEIHQPLKEALRGQLQSILKN